MMLSQRQQTEQDGRRLLQLHAVVDEDGDTRIGIRFHPPFSVTHWDADAANCSLSFSNSTVISLPLVTRLYMTVALQQI